MKAYNLIPLTDADLEQLYLKDHPNSDFSGMDRSDYLDLIDLWIEESVHLGVLHVNGYGEIFLVKPSN